MKTMLNGSTLESNDLNDSNLSYRLHNEFHNESMNSYETTTTATTNQYTYGATASYTIYQQQPQQIYYGDPNSSQYMY
jgi:hypothetical protein